MKKIIIFLLCFLMIFPNSLITYAAESSENIMNQQESPDVPLGNIEYMEETTTPLENTESSEKVITSTEPQDEQLIEEITTDEKDRTLHETESTEEETIIEIDDPQCGRANGYLDSSFIGSQSFSTESEYIHADRFKHHEIYDGIDVSVHQGKINWSEIKQSGIDFAFIRAGFRGYGETGSLNTDDNFKTNITEALAEGIKVGVYFFSQAITEDEAAAEAEHILALISDYEITLPVVIDFEYASTKDGLIGRLYNAGLSKGEATAICNRFCTIVENAGYSGMVYANKDMLENGLNADEIAKNHKIWLANYGTYSTYEGDYEFWQYTNTGSIDGIEGYVDRNFWYKEKEASYTNVSEGIYTISSCLNTSQVFDIPSASDKAGLPLQLYSKNGAWAQRFYIRQEQEDTYIIMSATTGKVLESDSGKVIQNNYNGSFKQQWRFILNDDDSLSVESVIDSFAMEVQNENAVNKAQILLHERSGVKAQSYYINRVDDTRIRNVTDGYYLIETVLLNDKVISAKSDGVSLELKTVAATDMQKFKFEYSETGCYRIYSASNSTPLFSADEKWIARNYDSGMYSFISAKDGKKIDIASAKTADGTRVQKYSGNGHNAQKFKLYTTKLGAEILEEGIYVIHSALDDTKVVDLSGGSMKCDANIQLYSANGKTPQRFVIKQNDDRSYKILSYHSGMAVAVKDNQDTNKANVIQYFSTNTIGQKWNIVPTGKGYYNIVSCVGGKLIDVAGGKTTNGTNIWVYQANGKAPQKFRFEHVGNIADYQINEKVLESGTYTIASSANEKQMVDLAGGSLYTGANIQLYTSNNCSAQQFIIQKDANSNFYTITSKRSGMHIAYADGKLKNSTNIRQESPTSSQGNKWRIQHIVGDYYKFYAYNSNFCLDVAGGKTANGTNIQLYQSNGYKAQIFKLQKISNQVTPEQNTSIALNEGLYSIASALDNNKLLDVPSGLSQDGLNIQLYQKNNATPQKFIIRKISNGNYTITALCSGKLLTVSGSAVVQQSENGSSNQQWKAIYSGNGYYSFESVYNGKMLDVKGGKNNNGTKIQTYTSNHLAPQRFKLISLETAPESKFVSNGNNGYTLSYDVYTKGNESSADNKYYLMLADSYAGKIYGSPLTSISKTFDVSINLSIADRSKLKEIAINKLVLAAKQSNGTYKAINTPVAVANPEAIAKNTTAIFKASSKKGIQGVAYASNGSMPVDARYANTKQTLLNLDIADVVNPKSNYTNFTYKGKTYKFSTCSDLVANVKSMNAGYQQYLYGNNGNTKVAVSLCLLLSYDSANSYLIDPAARSSGHRYYTLNVREEKGRETLEALFVYLGELFGQEDCYVTNWILGNEINSSKAWNYQGSLSFDNYMTCYTTAFRMLYNAVKSEKTGNTLSISLDNGWTAAPDTYAGKTVLDSFAKKINALNPNIKWSISYHPYSYPLTRADFWNDSSNTTNSTSTKYISMKNITVLTNYAASLEKTYKMPTGSIRVLLTEQGYSYGAGAEKQAQAIARGYYTAEFNNRIDVFIIRAIVDDAEEAKGKLYFGLMNSQQDKRIAFYVYEFMDSDLSKLKNTAASSVVTSPNHSKFNSAKNILCNTNWKSIVPGFNASKLSNIH